MRRILLLFVVALLVGTGAGAAAAQQTLTLDDILSDLRTQGYFVEPGSGNVDETELSEVVAEMNRAGSRFFPVVLADEVSGGATNLAATLADDFNDVVTVVVLTPADLGWDSGLYTEEALLAAGNAALPLFDSDVSAGFTAFAATLEPDAFAGQTPPTTTPATGGNGDGGGFPWPLLIVVVGLVAVVFFVVRRNSKRQEVRREEDVDEAREEIKRQLDAIANEILEEEEAVRLSDSAAAKDHFEAANATYASALDAFEKTSALRDLEQISDALDKARWQLAASKALRRGEPVPPEPKKERRATCFFDPTHPPATEKAVLRTSAGEREVAVCPADAERLQRGEQPRPRTINVGGRPMPAPMAPKSYGGGGFGWMDAFQVILGGMAASGALGGGRRRRRGGGFGGLGDIFGGGGPQPRARTHRRDARRQARATRPSTRRSGGGRVRGGLRRG